LARICREPATVSGFIEPASLAHHQIAYRAQVRAKVTALRSAQGDPMAARRARDLLDLAASHLRRGAVRLVLVGGLPDAGRTWRDLLEHGVLVRDVGIPHYLRVTAGTPAETDAFLAARAQVAPTSGRAATTRQSTQSQHRQPTPAHAAHARSAPHE
jgi:histidinol-phosphate aminotransferase